MSMSISMSKFYLHCVLLLDIPDVKFKVIGLVDFVVARPNQNSIIIIIIIRTRGPYYWSLSGDQ